MRVWLTVEDKLYCDWLVNVTECEDWSFYRATVVFQAAVCFLCVLVSFGISVYRRVARKDSMISFIMGGNATLTACHLSTMCLFVHSILLLRGTTTMVTNITMPFATYIGFIAHVSFFNSIKDAHLTTYTNLKSSTSSSRRSRIIFFGFFFLSFIITITFFSLASYYDLNPHMNNLFYRCGVNFMAFSLGIMSIMFIYTSIVFIRHLGHSVEKGVPEMMGEENKQRMVLLSIAIARVKRISAEIAFMEISYVTTYALVGCFPYFFVISGLSKSFCIMLNCFAPFSILLVLTLSLATEVKKYLVEKSISERSKRTSSKATSDVRVEKNGNYTLDVHEITLQEN